MTTNKPEVARYDYGYTDDGCGGDRYLGLIRRHDGKLVRHEDYETLQAECKLLREHLQNLIDQTTPLDPVPGNPMWSRRIQLDEVIAERDQLRAECEKLRRRARAAEREYSKVARTLKGLERVAKVVSDNSDAVCSENNQLRVECEKLRKDAKRLDWIVSEGVIVAHAGVRGEPHRYRVEWPLLGEVGINWFTSERDAIDTAMEKTK